MAQQRIITPPQIDNFSRRNAIINGNFDIWQRGSSFSFSEVGSPFIPTDDYTADRWVFTPRDHTSFSGNITREEFQVGQTEVPNEPRYYIRADITTASGGSVPWHFFHRIENALTFAGSDVVLSFYARLATPSSDVRVRILQVVNLDGSPGGVFTAFIDENVSIGTSWEKFVFPASLPFLSFPVGLGRDFVQVDVGVLENTTNTLDLAQVQLEQGVVPSEFEHRSLGEELALCQRYYHKSYPLDVEPGTPGQQNIGTPHMFSVDNPADDYIAGAMRFPVVMRTTPSITIYRPSTGDVGAIENVAEDDPGSPGNFVAPASVEVGPEGLAVFSMDTVLDAAEAYQFHYTADAEL